MAYRGPDSNSRGVEKSFSTSLPLAALTSVNNRQSGDFAVLLRIPFFFCAAL